MTELLDKNQRNLKNLVPSESWLAKGNNAEHFLLWNTFYRRNLHLFARDYFGLTLHWYQSIILYLMGISTFIVMIASRAAAKSFIIGVYSSCRAELYPNSNIVLTSGTRGQSRLIVTEKILKELIGYNPNGNLARAIDISHIAKSATDVSVPFKNGSKIFTVTCSKNARGNRSTVNVGEEAREIDKALYKEVIDPFHMVRQVDFMKLPDYEGDLQFQEEPTSIFISSSVEETHWLYKTALEARNGMFKEDGSLFLAFDYSISLRHGIKTKQELKKKKQTTDPITWAIEYENRVYRSNTKSFYTLEMLRQNQNLIKPFYPRTAEDYISSHRKMTSMPKQPGEIRVVACDIAMVNRTGNDNSVSTCMRLFPEVVDEETGVAQDFRIQIPYLEGYKGVETQKQAINIRRLYEDFEADYIVLDIRNSGIAIFDSLAKVLYDKERGKEYAPLTCMNDPVIAKRIPNPNAKPVIFAIAASAKLNSEMAVNLQRLLIDKRIDLLISKEEAINEIPKFAPQYLKTQEPEEQLFYEKPYMETALLINEMISLEYERLETTGLIRIHERGNEVKDRYSSLAMGLEVIAS